MAKPKVYRRDRWLWAAEFRFRNGTNVVMFHTWREAFDYAYRLTRGGVDDPLGVG